MELSHIYLAVQTTLMSIKPKKISYILTISGRPDKYLGNFQKNNVWVVYKVYCDMYYVTKLNNQN